jgi:hypothetical protein
MRREYISHDGKYMIFVFIDDRRPPTYRMTYFKLSLLNVISVVWILMRKLIVQMAQSIVLFQVPLLYHLSFNRG